MNFLSTIKCVSITVKKVFIGDGKYFFFYVINNIDKSIKLRLKFIFLTLF